MTGWNSNRRASTFSNKNLTTLESLVLECQLEDAKNYSYNSDNNSNSNNGGIPKSSIADCEMSCHDVEFLSKLPGNDSCADCGKLEDTEWASVTFGILLCASCSGVHRALGTHISRVRSIKMDSWSDEQLQFMRSGGNSACQRYLQKKGGFAMDDPIEDKYSSEAAEKYKQLLKQTIANAQKPPATPTKMRTVASLDETESSTDSTAASSLLLSPYPYSPSTSLQEVAAYPTMDCSTKSFMDDCDQEEEDEIIEEDIKDDVEKKSTNEDESKPDKEKDTESHLGALDSWFSKMSKPKSPAAPPSGGVSVSMASATSSRRARRSFQRSHSSASAPTITYMGRSFSADGSDDNKLLSRHEARLRRQSDVKLLAELADQQDEIAREHASTTPWRHHSMQPQHYYYFSADKKVEPFASSEGSMGGSHKPRRTLSYSSASRQHDVLRQKLAFTDADLLDIAQDDKEFARLKAGLKNRGAVTNEVLKQRLYAFVANSKLRRLSATNREKEGGNGGKRRSVSSTKSEDLSLMRSHTIHTNTAKRL